MRRVCCWNSGFEEDIDVDWQLTIRGKLIRGTGRIPPIKMTPDGRFLVYVGREFEVKIWNLVNKIEFARFYHHNCWISDLQFNKEFTLLVAASFDKTFSIWNLRDKQIVDTVSLTSYVFSIAINGDSSIIVAACSDWNIFLFKIQEKELTSVRKIHKSYVLSLFFDQEDQVVSLGFDRIISIWRYGEGQRVIKKIHIGPLRVLSTSYVKRKSLYIVGYEDFRFIVFRI